jgi:hypothetical protein
LSFLDAYSGYHQISLVIDDKFFFAFISPFEIFYYKKMVFCLKNGGATYEKGIQIILETQSEWNVETCIDDMVVKSKKREDLLDNLKDTFNNIRMYKMMLNPRKYVFGISSGKQLGYMVSARGIDANQKKVEVIEQLQPSWTWREI